MRGRFSSRGRKLAAIRRRNFLATWLRIVQDALSAIDAGDVPYTEDGTYLLAREMARGQGYDPADVVRESCRFEGGVLHFTVVPKIRQVTLTGTVEI